MNKTSFWLFVIWAVLAVASFVSAFFVTPMFAKIIGIVFGAENMMIIGGWLYGRIMEKRANRQEKDEEE